jgi:arylsulfatase A-like enzyme
MSSRPSVVEVTAAGRPPQDRAFGRLGPVTLLALSAWCGLGAGLLEVGILVVRKRMFDRNHFYWMSRHFLWLTPLANLLVFLAVGVVLSLLVMCSRRRGQWLALRLLGALALLPPLWAAFPGIYGPAGVLVALGIAAQAVPALELRRTGFHRLVRVSFPIFAGVVPVLAATLWVPDRLKTWRESARPLPPPGSANVLLIVLDTVAAGHLSLYGCNRPTSPTIDELATRGIRFERAQAASSWTLPSVAGMFTGRYSHELSAGWHTPLDRAHPTLAEFLASRGYATAGFSANRAYCATDSGLARGFTVYEDYIFPRLTALRTAVLVDRLTDGLDTVERFLEEWADFDLLKPVLEQFWRLFKADRKDAAELNREFLTWMARRGQPERPFFAFLNYFDAHNPYEIPATGIHRFGFGSEDEGESSPIHDWLRVVQRGPSGQDVAVARGAYDDCVAHLDEQLGRLYDELERRAVLDRTWVIITADHGESFGEHARVFLHGGSLYQTERHVPLVIIPPGGSPTQRVVTEAVSLCDLAATVVDILGFRAASPFPGNSMARFWDGLSPEAPGDSTVAGQAFSELFPDPDALGPELAQSPELTGPVVALTEGDWTYLRRDSDGREELFHLAPDANELHNLAGDPALEPTLVRMRTAASRRAAGPVSARSPRIARARSGDPGL